jgi:glycosyltransferase involved in cell wall biosynthesis
MNRSFPILISDPGREGVSATLNVTPQFRVSGPVVSCLMVSRGQRFPAALAIDCYRRQTYQNRELVIVSASSGCEIRKLVEELADPTIRYIPAAPATLGELRNVSVAHAVGELMCQWDDDDLSSSDRIELMLGAFLGSESKACLLYTVTLWWPERRMAAISSHRTWENTILVHRNVLPAYPARQMFEDTDSVKMVIANHRAVMLSAPEIYIYVVHGNNVCSAQHFSVLFNSASSELTGTAYDAWVEDNSARVPLGAYAEMLDRVRE